MIDDIKPGTRVGAAESATKHTIRLYGYGVYQGDEAGGPSSQIFGPDHKNPKIVLDDGTVVWGCECWWGEEQKFKEELVKGRNVVMVKVPERT